MASGDGTPGGPGTPVDPNAADGGNEMFSTTTPLPVAGPVGYTVRVLPHHPLLAGDNELGLVTMA